jgi:hypothetical protein
MGLFIHNVELEKLLNKTNSNPIQGNKPMKKILNLLAGLSALGMVSAQAATTYVGNGSTAWGGTVGNGNIVIDDTSSGVLTFTINATTPSNAFVLYIDSKSGGFNSTAGFQDGADALRRAISGYDSTANGGGVGKSTTLMPFSADYAIGVDAGWGGMWELANGGDNSLIYRATALSGGFGSGNNVLTLNVSDLGLTANSGQSFNFFAMMVSPSGFTSPEFIGASSISGSNGWGNTQTVGVGSTYTLIPEPSSSLLMGLGLAGLLALRKTRKA